MIALRWSKSKALDVMPQNEISVKSNVLGRERWWQENKPTELSTLDSGSKNLGLDLNVCF